MIIDTSAVMAMLRNEPEATAFTSAIREHRSVSMSAGTHLECSIVVLRWSDPVALRGLDYLVTRSAMIVVPVSYEQARIARSAYRDFGRGSGHPARLNFGDCFAYALAIDTGEPLLYKGDDFGHTDVRSAIEDRPR